MFPDIAREDVFRLETRRLWLRWPIPADAEAGLGFLISDDRAGGTLPEPSAGDPSDEARAARRIATWRDRNAEGRALHLVMTGRGLDRTPVGAVWLAPVRERIEDCGLLLRAALDPARRGQGLMTEAVQAVVDAAFMLTDASVVATSARVLDPAFKRVLEKCGFAFCGTALDGSTGGALVACDRFRLDRKAWESLKTWRVPTLSRGLATEHGLAACPAP